MQKQNKHPQEGSDQAVRIWVPVMHYRLPEESNAPVAFTVYQDAHSFRAVPSLSMEERALTGLPPELHFCFSNQCITEANDSGEDALRVIKQILLELEAQDLL